MRFALFRKKGTREARARAVTIFRGELMRRVYHCVLLLAVVLECVLAIGCSSGTSTMVQVTTTSLPDGTVASPYSATLTATGGTSPYTWTQSSGGAMPGGVSLGSAGIFAGTPTAAGTF